MDNRIKCNMALEKVGHVRLAWFFPLIGYLIFQTKELHREIRFYLNFSRTFSKVSQWRLLDKLEKKKVRKDGERAN